ncbi:MAG TPA: hypothetical protein VFP58_00575 [Candidatus Eisenbacteria bacterium]|nr:hypothetical protein [Candidatus Eisenbacteria bacterium]
MSLHRIAVVAAILSGIAGASTLRASPEPWNATVLWARADRAYVVLADSAAVEPGTALTFEEDGTTIARGEVVVAHEDQLISVRVISGSLAKARSLSRVKIFAEPPSLRAMPLLRIGYPSPGRPNLLFDCARIVPRAGASGDLYRVDALSDRSYRFVRAAGVPAGSWPDTILVRLYDVSADEEIALERGDLDVAVFWPGEPSPHIRAHTSWKDDPAGSLEGGSLTVEAPPGTDAEGIVWRRSAAQALRAMNDDLFRGDLAECGSDLSSATSDSVPVATAPHIKFDVNRAIPGWQPLERRLNQGLPAKPGATLVVRMNRVQRPYPAAFSGEGSGSAGSPADSAPGACAFEIRCPVLSAPRLRPYLHALGPDALVRLFTCSSKQGGR